MDERLRFIQVGMGPIGQRIIQYLLERDTVELAAAVDIDPEKAGRRVDEFLPGGQPCAIRIDDDAEATLAGSDADVVVLATRSSFADLADQLRQCIRHRKNVVSSCEELAFPWIEDAPLAAEIDAAARAAGVTVLATGVNPGFAMDALPVFLTSLCRRVDAVRVQRHQDAARRRLPFQRKIGAGLSPEEFREQAAAKIIRHVGFTQSVQMIARAVGWTLDRIEDVVEPVVARRDLESPFLRVRRGEVAGLVQTATGYLDGRPVVTIELEACLGHPAPLDAVRIEGDPPLCSEVKGGIPGDVATCAIVANSVPLVRRAEPGLRTMLDVGLTSWFR